VPPRRSAVARITLVGGIGVGGQHGGLAHAVALQNGVAGALLPFGEGLDQQGGRPGNEQAHVFHRRLVERGLGQHAHIQRGHAHEHGGLACRAMARLGSNLAIQIILLPLISAPWMATNRPCTWKMGKAWISTSPGLRPTGCFPAPIVLERDGVAQQVAVREHGPLLRPVVPLVYRMAARSSAHMALPGVLVAVVRGALEQAAGAVVAQGEHMLRARLEGNFADPAKVGRAAHHHSRFGIANESSRSRRFGKRC
jgi:hypothetical protein